MRWVVALALGALALPVRGDVAEPGPPPTTVALPPGADDPSGAVAPAAAPPAWRLSAGTGAGGFVEFADAFVGSAPGPYDSSRRTGRRQLNLRVDREVVGERLRAGLAYTLNLWTERYEVAGREVGAIDNTFQTLLVDLTWIYVRAPHVDLYGAVGIGAGRWSQEGSGIAAASGGTSAGLAFQLRFFGISAGNERVRAFAELGVGFEGIAIAGLTLRI